MKFNATNFNGVLKLGKSGESNVIQIIFDISKWVEEFGTGSAVLLVLRPEDDTPYITTTELEDGIVTWNVSSTDTAYPGIGECELQYIADDYVKKSRIWKTVTLRSLEDAGESPDPESGWVADLLSQIQDMIDSIEACSYEIATDEEVEEMLEEIYSTSETCSCGSATTDTCSCEIATDEEVNEMLEEIY